MTVEAQPVGGRLSTPAFKLWAALAGLGALLIAWRFGVGLGPSTGLSDGIPWGLWIAFDVVTGTALACGGYAVALVVYILNRGRYHPLVRPALLTSAIGYSLAGLAIAVDVGRPWLVYRIPFSPAKWNLNSALLEVALCVMAYIIVLWIELSPAFLDRWREGRPGALQRFSAAASPKLERALPWIIALGLLLPTMHQSSLGSLMLLTGPKLHGLWNTPLLPLLFLVSCFTMGYAMVALESTLSARAFRRPLEMPMLRMLFKAGVATSGVFLVLRFGDLLWRGRFGLAFTFDRQAAFFWLETLLFALPVVLLLSRRKIDQGLLTQSALLLALAGAAYRFGTYLVAFDPGPGWSYFPTVPEILITIGIVAMEVLLYIAIVKTFPILSGRVTTAPAR